MLAVESSWGASTLSSCNTHMNIHETYVSPNSCTVCILALKHRRGLHSVRTISVQQKASQRPAYRRVWGVSARQTLSQVSSPFDLYSALNLARLRDEGTARGKTHTHTNRTTHVKSRHNFQQEDMKHTLATEPLPPSPPPPKARPCAKPPPHTKTVNTRGCEGTRDCENVPPSSSGNSNRKSEYSQQPKTSNRWGCFEYWATVNSPLKLRPFTATSVTKPSEARRAPATNSLEASVGA